MNHRTAAVLATLVLLTAACGDDDVLVTDPPEPTAAPTTTTAAPTTTTTLPPFPGDLDPKDAPVSGSPNGNLVDVRTGKHPGFTRIVWEMDGATGTPWYQIGFGTPPFVNIGGFEVPVDGSAFLHVFFFPGMRYDISDPVDIVQTYFGPEVIVVGVGSVEEVVFIEDFEATMEWVVGLTAEKPFHVFTLENPTRLVIDIAD